MRAPFSVFSAAGERLGGVRSGDRSFAPFSASSPAAGGGGGGGGAGISPASVCWLAWGGGCCASPPPELQAARAKEPRTISAGAVAFIQRKSGNDINRSPTTLLCDERLCLPTSARGPLPSGGLRDAGSFRLWRVLPYRHARGSAGPCPAAGAPFRDPGSGECISPCHHSR